MNNTYTMAIIKNGKITFQEIKDELKEYYKIIDCELIEVLNLKINGNMYTFIFDEEGKLKESYNNIALIDKANNILDILKGNVIIQKYDYNEELLIDLTKFDINNLNYHFKNCKQFIDFSQNKLIPTITI